MKDSKNYEKASLTIAICTLNKLSSIKTNVSSKNQMVKM